ncbi:MAG: alkaline phosphatase family protein [Cyclobacteriaceae bacterium]|jgi:alkaline phosphatase D|nr:alkaline phosphatase family protein [Cyclobacteriaceae bacterium]
MKHLSTLLLCLVIGTALAQSQTVIAFGSCAHQNNENQLWDDIVAQQPTLWIWGGDNIYGDTHNLTELQTKYDKQKSRPSYQRLIQTMPVTGTWDDHDYGHNDAGRFYTQRYASKKLAAEFLGFGPTHEVWTHEGLYNSHHVGKGKRQVHIINLDTRFFRDTVQRAYTIDSVTNERRYRYVATEGDILGEAQWQWLDQQLATSRAAIIFVNSSIQILSEEHRFEKWANFPQARARLFNLLIKHKDKRVFLLSGDRHIAEISRLAVPGLPYPLYDFTSSGLTHTWREAEAEANRHRVSDLIIQKNFGLIRIDWGGPHPNITFEIRGKDNTVFATHRVQMN